MGSLAAGFSLQAWMLLSISSISSSVSSRKIGRMSSSTSSSGRGSLSAAAAGAVAGAASSTVSVATGSGAGTGAVGGCLWFAASWQVEPHGLQLCTGSRAERELAIDFDATRDFILEAIDAGKKRVVERIGIIPDANQVRFKVVRELAQGIDTGHPGAALQCMQVTQQQVQVFR